MVNSSLGILSLPLDILDEIMELIALLDSPILRPLLRPSVATPFKISHFRHLRKSRENSPYAIRRRSLYSPTWNWLGINPPIRELAQLDPSTRSGPSQVFTANARILRLDLSFLEENDIFSDDNYEEFQDLKLSVGMPDGFPNPLRRSQKQGLFESLIQDIKEMLPKAISSFTKVSEIRYDIYSDSGSSWLRLTHAEALSSLPKLQTLVLTTPMNSRTWGPDWRGTNTPPSRPILEGLLTVISNQLHVLQTIDFSFREKSFPSDLDHLWKSLTLTTPNDTIPRSSSSICLRSLSINAAAISMDLFRFLASFSGLETLLLTLLETFGGAGRNIGYMPTDHQDLSAFFFEKVLKSHHKTLTRLQMPCFDTTTDGMGRWAIGPTNVEHLAQCTKIRSLTTVCRLLSLWEAKNVEQKLEQLLDLIRSLSPLTELRLICTGLESRPCQFLSQIDQAFKSITIPQTRQETSPSVPTRIGIVGMHWHSSANVLQYELTRERPAETKSSGADLQWRYRAEDTRIRSYH